MDWYHVACCFSQIAEDHRADPSGNEPVGLKTGAKAIGALCNTPDPGEQPGLVSKIRRVFIKFDELLQNHPDITVVTEGVKTFAPLEMVAVCILISRLIDFRKREELAEDINKLRRGLRKRLKDLRLNTQCWNVVRDIIKALMGKATQPSGDAKKAALLSSTSSHQRVVSSVTGNSPEHRSPASASRSRPSANANRAIDESPAPKVIRKSPSNGSSKGPAARSVPNRQVAGDPKASSAGQTSSLNGNPAAQTLSSRPTARMLPSDVNHAPRSPYTPSTDQTLPSYHGPNAPGRRGDRAPRQDSNHAWQSTSSRQDMVRSDYGAARRDEPFYRDAPLRGPENSYPRQSATSRPDDRKLGPHHNTAAFGASASLNALPWPSNDNRFAQNGRGYHGGGDSHMSSQHYHDVPRGPASFDRRKRERDGDIYRHGIKPEPVEADGYPYRPARDYYSNNNNNNNNNKRPRFSY